jgi:FkbM family methyltransferase
LTNWRFLFEKWVTGKYDPEPEIIETFRRIRGKLFVDVGANVGRYAVGLSDNFDEIIAIEPNPRAGDMLLKRAAKNGRRNVKLIRSAISNKPGPVTLYLNSPTSINRLARRLRPYSGFSGSADTIMAEFDYKPAYTSQPDHLYKGKKGIAVNAVPLDYIISDRTVDLCKIDVEGAEFLVLESATNALEEGRIIRIMVEIHNRERKTELESILRSYEFELRWLDPGRVYGERTKQKSIHEQSRND